MHGMDNFKIVGLFKDDVFISEVIFYRRWYPSVFTLWTVVVIKVVGRATQLRRSFAWRSLRVESYSYVLCELWHIMYVGHVESKERLRIQPAQLFNFSWWVMWCVQ